MMVSALRVHPQKRKPTARQGSAWRVVAFPVSNDEVSDAGLRQRQTKLIYPNHRLPPWLNEDVTPRSLEPIVRPDSPRRRVGQSRALALVMP